MNQIDLENKYSKQLWRHNLYKMLMSQKIWQEILLNLCIKIELLVLNMDPNSYENKRWNNFSINQEVLLKVFVRILEGILVATRYSEEAVINSFLLNIANVISKHCPEKDNVYNHHWILALDMIGLLSKVVVLNKEIVLWEVVHTHEETEEGIETYLAIKPNKTILKPLLDLQEEYLNLPNKPLPMVEPPRPWTSVDDGGYYAHRYSYVKRGFKPSSLGIMLEAANHKQSCAWKLNVPMLKKFNLQDFLIKGKQYSSKDRVRLSKKYFGEIEDIEDKPIYILESADTHGRMYCEIAYAFDFKSDHLRKSMYVAWDAVPVEVEDNNYR